MLPNRRSTSGSAGASRSTSRYCFSALSNRSAANDSLARDRSWSLVGDFSEQPAIAMAIRETAASFRILDPQGSDAIAGAAPLKAVGPGVGLALIMEVLPMNRPA